MPEVSVDKTALKDTHTHTHTHTQNRNERQLKAAPKSTIERQEKLGKASGGHRSKQRVQGASAGGRAVHAVHLVHPSAAGRRAHAIAMVAARHATHLRLAAPARTRVQLRRRTANGVFCLFFSFFFFSFFTFINELNITV